MKVCTLARIYCTFCLLFIFQLVFAQNPVNWTEKQLLKPSVLAENLKTGNEASVIFSVGPGAIIPGSIDIGMVRDTTNLEKFRARLAGISRNNRIVIYCGCCPFDHCPNVRPAIQVLKEMKFTNYQLLDLPHNIKTDWIDKGYPQIKS